MSDKVNPKLVNALVILGIVCAVSFLALWAIPTLSQKVDTTKHEQNATTIANEPTEAEKTVKDQIYGIFPRENFSITITPIEKGSPDIYSLLRKQDGKNGARESAIVDLTMSRDIAVCYLFEVVVEGTGIKAGYYKADIVVAYKKNGDKVWQTF